MFSGAATPANGSDKCLDPAAIFYRENASCQITSMTRPLLLYNLCDVTCLFLLFPAAFVEFKNSTYVVSEKADYQQICLNSGGYDFYSNFSATYHDNDNFTEGIATVIANVTSI